MQIEGDLIIALSDGAFVSFSISFPKAGKRLIGNRSFQVPLFRGTNVGRNVIAHELGHAIGLGHNDDPSNLMCGRAASCRPNAFRSNVDHYFPLTEEEKQFLLKLYPRPGSELAQELAPWSIFRNSSPPSWAAVFVICIS